MKGNPMTGRPITALSLTLFLLIINVHSAHSSDELLFFTNDFPPYAFKEKGRFSGIAVDIVKELMNRTGDCGKICVMPWKRALECSKRKTVMLFPYTRVPYREKQFKWIGPIMRDRFVFAVPASDNRNYTSIDDFRTVQVGVSVCTPTFHRLRELGFSRLQIVLSEKQNAKKLTAVKRIDAWYAPYLILKYTLHALDIEEKKVRIAFRDKEVDMYIGTSLKVPDKTVAAWQRNLDTMKKTVKYQALLSQNRYQWELP